MPKWKERAPGKWFLRAGPLYMYAEDNGASWFNWWIAFEEDDYADTPDRKEGGGKNATVAKAAAVKAAKEIGQSIIDGLA